MPYVEDKFSIYVPFLELISLDNDEVVIGDSKKDRVVGVKARSSDGGYAKFYCEADNISRCNELYEANPRDCCPSALREQYLFCRFAFPHVVLISLVVLVGLEDFVNLLCL
jgi:hypothetical protein